MNCLALHPNTPHFLVKLLGHNFSTYLFTPQGLSLDDKNAGLGEENIELPINRRQKFERQRRASQRFTPQTTSSNYQF